MYRLHTLTVLQDTGLILGEPYTHNTRAKYVKDTSAYAVFHELKTNIHASFGACTVLSFGSST